MTDTETAPQLVKTPEEDALYRSRHAALVERIEREGEENGFLLKMNSWLLGDKGNGNWCGTSACLGGAAVLLRAAEEHDFAIEYDSIAHDAAEWLGLDTSNRAPCFNSLFSDVLSPTHPTPAECAEALAAAYEAQDPEFDPWAPIVERRRDQCDLD